MKEIDTGTNTNEKNETENNSRILKRSID